MSPTLNFGDFIVVTPPTQTIAAGTIIVMNVNGALVTHRLLTDFQGGWPETKGDDNNVADNFSGSNLTIVGVVHYYIPYLAYPFMYARHLVSTIGL